MSNLQLSNYLNYDTKKLIFSKPEIGNIPGQKINFKRIRIATCYDDGSVGDLILSTPPNLMSFGLQESRDMVTNQINGYTLPLCLWNRNGPTNEETAFTNTFNSICDAIKTYLIEHKEEIEKYDLDMADLKKFNPLFWKMEKGKIVENRGPMLYSKVIWNKKKNTIQTIFVDEETNEETNPMDLLNKQCNVTAAIKFESIFIGNKISLQVKLFETVFRVKEHSIRGLLRPDAVKRSVSPTHGEESVHPVFSSDVPPGGANFQEEDDEIVMEEDEDTSEEDEDEEVPSIPVRLETPVETLTTKTTPAVAAVKKTEGATTPAKRGVSKASTKK